MDFWFRYMKFLKTNDLLNDWKWKNWVRNLPYYCTWRHLISNVHNIKRFLDKCSCHFSSLSYKKLPITDIYKVEFLLNSTTVVEKPHPPKSPTQFYTCQSYRHARDYCLHDNRCVRCGENLLSDSCTNPCDTPARCALCNGSHTVNYKGCPKYKKLKRSNHPIWRDPSILTSFT